MAFQATETLQELVALPSVNPMGRPVDGDIYFEHRVTDYLQAQFEKLGLPFARQTVEPQRENILARLDATEAPESAPLILWEVHQDTVPIDGMTIDPFRPQPTADKILGRGSCDVKGAMASMLAALARLVKEPHRPANILFACTINEEHGYGGAKELVKLWDDAASAAEHVAARKLVPRRPDLAIIAEPTEMNVVVAHKGAIRWRIKTLGKACHSSNPDNGLNAIYLTRPILEAIEAYQAHVTRLGHNHPHCGRPTVSVGIVSGGVSVNTVPDHCSLEIDRRVTPGEVPRAAREEMIAFIDDFLRQQVEAGDPSGHAARLLDGAMRHEEPHLSGRPLDDVGNAELAEYVRGHSAAVHGESKIIGVPFGTDAAVIAASGIPSVVFGPGSILQAHTCDEWISITQLEEAVDVFVRLGKHPLGG